MAYHYTNYPYSLQPDEMFLMTDVDATTVNAMMQYQSYIEQGDFERAGELANTTLKGRIINAEVINSLQERIHATQDYALSLKTQGWYSDTAGNDPYSAVRLKGSVWRTKTGENSSLNVIYTKDYIKIENGESENGSDNYYRRFISDADIYARSMDKQVTTSGGKTYPNLRLKALDGTVLSTVPIYLTDLGITDGVKAAIDALPTEMQRKSAANAVTTTGAYNIVTGVKGNAETAYRKGFVNLTPHNLGAVQLSGDTMTGNLHIMRDTRNDYSISTGFFLFNRPKNSDSSNWSGALYVQANKSDTKHNDTPNDFVIKANHGHLLLESGAAGKEVHAKAWVGTNSSGDNMYRGLIVDGWYHSELKTYVGSVKPNVNECIYLGTSSMKWRLLYCKSATINTSDRNDKHDIVNISDKYEEMFKKLRPKSYMFNDGDRKHIGFIAQDVETAMVSSGLSTLDFAALCKDEKTISDEDGNVTKVVDENGKPVYQYGLRYGEFIALNTHMIQKLMARVDELEKKLGMKEDK